MSWFLGIFKQKKSPYPIIISFLTLRRIVGILGISLPILLILGSFTIGGCSQVQESISHYYYTIMRDVYVGVLFAIAIFLISYRGYNPVDNITTTLAGIFAICVALFPTTQNQDHTCAVYYIDHCDIRVYIHYGSAVLLFLTLAVISFFLFSRGAKSKRKKIRNYIYRTCGILLMLSVVLISLIRTIPAIENALTQYKPVFWIEWLGLTAFGISWLIKGETLFKDHVSKH